MKRIMLHQGKKNINIRDITRKKERRNPNIMKIIKDPPDHHMKYQKKNQNMIIKVMVVFTVHVNGIFH